MEIGIVGGTGIYKLAQLQDLKEYEIMTPFGAPSDKAHVGTLFGVRVVFLPRHGAGHAAIPSEINFRANLYALKLFGVKYLLSVSAVGSLQFEIPPVSLILPSQFIDLTKKRESTFFGNGAVAHVSFSHPVCPNFQQLVEEAIKEKVEAKLHTGGTYVCMEGPQFSTEAESKMYKVLGGDIIGMTAATEAKLAREAEMAFCLISLVTDYDSWHPGHDAVSVEMVLENLKEVTAFGQEAVVAAIEKISKVGLPESSAHDALKFAVMTPLESMDADTWSRLGLFLAKYKK